MKTSFLFVTIIAKTTASLMYSIMPRKNFTNRLQTHNTAHKDRVILSNAWRKIIKVSKTTKHNWTISIITQHPSCLNLMFLRWMPTTFNACTLDNTGWPMTSHGSADKRIKTWQAYENFEVWDRKKINSRWISCLLILLLIGKTARYAAIHQYNTTCRRVDNGL